jgi:hypothetical protein
MRHFAAPGLGRRIPKSEATAARTTESIAGQAPFVPTRVARQTSLMRSRRASVMARFLDARDQPGSSADVVGKELFDRDCPP